MFRFVRIALLSAFNSDIGALIPSYRFVRVLPLMMDLKMVRIEDLVSIRRRASLRGAREPKTTHGLQLRPNIYAVLKPREDLHPEELIADAFAFPDAMIYLGASIAKLHALSKGEMASLQKLIPSDSSAYTKIEEHIVAALSVANGPCSQTLKTGFESRDKILKFLAATSLETLTARARKHIQLLKQLRESSGAAKEICFQAMLDNHEPLSRLQNLTESCRGVIRQAGLFFCVFVAFFELYLFLTAMQFLIWSWHILKSKARDSLLVASSLTANCKDCWQHLPPQKPVFPWWQ